MTNRTKIDAALSQADGVASLLMFSIAALFLLPATGFAAVQQPGLGLFWSSAGAGVGLAIGVRLVRWRQSVVRRVRAGLG